MYHLNKSKLAFFDCDDTLATWDYSKYPHKEEDLIQVPNDMYNWKLLPHFKNIELLKQLKTQGYGIIVWSAAGDEWAKTIVEMFKLEPFVDVVMGKPEIVIDDLLDAKKIIKQVIWLDPITGEFKRNS